MEKCSKCKKVKPDDEFYQKSSPKTHSRKSGLSYYCKECDEGERREHPDRSKEIRARRKRLYPHLNQVQQWGRKYRINFAVSRYNEMFIQQKGCCAICGKHQSEFKHKLGIDHNHKTKQIRALLCPSCNRVVSHLEEGAEHLQKCQEYLKFWNNKAAENVSVA